MSTQPLMKLNHMSFPTHDAIKEAQFWKEHFGSTIEFVDEKSGSALLKHGGVDIVMDAMDDSVEWHDDFHFGFELPSKKEVDEIYEKMKKSGVIIETEVFNRVGRGSRFFGRTPSGVQFEINTREDMDAKWNAKNNK